MEECQSQLWHPLPEAFPQGFPESGKTETRMAGKHPAPELSQLALPHSRHDTAPELAPSGLFPS